MKKAFVIIAIIISLPIPGYDVLAVQLIENENINMAADRSDPEEFNNNGEAYDGNIETVDSTVDVSGNIDQNYNQNHADANQLAVEISTVYDFIWLLVISTVMIAGIYLIKKTSHNK